MDGETEDMLGASSRRIAFEVLLEADSALAHRLAHVQLVVFIDGLLFN